jgi:hypothetical protein
VQSYCLAVFQRFYTKGHGGFIFENHPKIWVFGDKISLHYPLLLTETLPTKQLQVTRSTAYANSANMHFTDRFYLGYSLRSMSSYYTVWVI